MYLDETILQSRTTLSLVEFIDELWENIEPRAYANEGEFLKLERKYLEVKEKANKASKKRSFK